MNMNLHGFLEFVMLCLREHTVGGSALAAIGFFSGMLVMYSSNALAVNSMC